MPALACFPLRRALLLSALLITALPQRARPRLLRAAATPARTKLTAGAALTPPGYITSPSGDFAFGFRALGADPTKFLLATWFRVGDDAAAAGDSQSVVWFAKQSPSGGTPVATAGSVLSVMPDGTLALTDGGGRRGQVLWRAPTTSRLRRGSVLALRDSGNLQFLGDSGDVLWESFGYPTDTLLPGQSLALDSRSEGKLFSKRSDTEFTTGRFSMGVQPDGNVVLYVDLLAGNNPDNAYWQQHTNSANGKTTVTFDGRGRLNYTLENGTVYSFISPPASFAAGGDYFQFARIDPDGMVRTYARRKNYSTSWTRLGLWPPNGCNKRTSGLQGMCAPGSYCVQNDDRLACVCPSGYTYTDALHKDGGCTPAFEPQSCGGEDSSDEFALVELPNTTWETLIYYKKFPSVTEEQCREYCLRDCFCVAALFTGGSDCVEVAVLTNGRQANELTTKTLVKVRTGSAGQWARTRSILRPYKILTVCLVLLLAITIGGLLAQHYLGKNRNSNSNRNRNRESQQLLRTSVRAFSWKELHEATNGFEKLLGRGSFGEVYQGTMRSPEPHLIAVKKLIDSNDYSEQEFTNEVQSIGQIHHRNLVRMIGYCKEGKHRMLVFEFMPGGSLRSFLFNPEKRRPPWRWRTEAALAIAWGLEYLHDGCSAPIIHCDIKPENILLDSHGVPRITDFGISKLLRTQQVHTTVTHVRGTRGYIAPEWLLGDGRVDTKADVYSFGVVLLELISCRRCHEPVVADDLPQGVASDEMVTLCGWAAQLVGARRTDIMLQGDGDDVDSVEDMEKVERFARVALWCVEANPVLRPTMHKVVQMLETDDGGHQFETLHDTQSCYTESSPLISQLKSKIK